MTKQIALTGLHVTLDPYDGEGEATLTLVTTDSRRVARMVIPWAPEQESDIVAPFGDSVLPFASAMVDAVDAFTDCDSVALGVEPHVLSLTSPTRSVVLRLLHEDYPTTAELFLRKPPQDVRLDAKQLVPAFKRVDQVKNTDTDQVALTFRPDTLILSASQEGKGVSDEEFAIEYDGPDARVLVKSTFLQSMLNTAPGGVVVAAFNPEKYEPIIVTAPADPAWRFIIMPMRPIG